MFCDDLPFRSLSREGRRERIVFAAKKVLLEKGLDEASMDDVAAAAGTTKPTVYAHFKSKEELFEAVVELVRRMFLLKLRTPRDYSEEPVEAVTLFCGRLLELASWRDAVGYQRAALGAAGKSPEIARAVYGTLFAEALRLLGEYLEDNRLTDRPHAQAELLLSMATGGPILRHLYGVEATNAEPPDDTRLGGWVDVARIREGVLLIAAAWKH